MIEFAQAWEELEVGERVRVSDGTLAPPVGSTAYPFWRSHNHEGNVEAKLDGPPRAILVRLDEVNGASVGYEVAEGSGDRFEVI